LKKLSDILYKVRLISVIGKTDIPVKDILIDSRKVYANTVFVAIKGEQSDGHNYIESALNSGASVIICETLPSTLRDFIVYVQVANTHEAVAFMAHNFYDEPSRKLMLVGVTGTNGKTTIATVLFKLFTQLGYKCGLISTVQNQLGKEIIPATHTTPDALALNELLNAMANAKCLYVFMECSSHAIHQHRITGLHFAGGIFSNITHDHLDYHKTFDEYIRVKKSFFDSLSSDAFALSNIDDKKRNGNASKILQRQKYTYSLKNHSRL